MVDIDVLNKVLQSRKRPLNYGARKYTSDIVSVHFLGARPKYKLLTENGLLSNNFTEPNGYNEKFEYVFNDYILTRHPNENTLFREWRKATLPIITNEIILKSYSEMKSILFQNPNFNYSNDNTKTKEVIEKSEFDNVLNEQILQKIYTDPNSAFLIVPVFIEESKPLEFKILNFSYEEVYSQVTDPFFIGIKGDLLYYSDANNIAIVSTKKGSTPYEYEHNLGKSLHIFTGGVYVSDVNYYKSFFEGFAVKANLLLRNISDDEGLMKLSGYPKMVEYAPICPTCTGSGVITKDCDTGKCDETCHDCNGTKTMSRNMGDVYTMPLKANNDLTPYPSKVFEFVNPDIGINSHSFERVKYLIAEAYKSLYLNDVSEAQSGVAKGIDQENKGIFVRSVGLRVYEVGNHILSGLISLSTITNNRYVWTESNMQYPTIFKLQTISSLIEELELQKAKGIDPAVRKETETKYIQIQFHDNPKLLKKHQILYFIDRLKGLSLAELQGKKMLGTITDRDLIINENVPHILDNLIYSNGDDWFMNTSVESIVKSLNISIDKLMAERQNGAFQLIP